MKTTEETARGSNGCETNLIGRLREGTRNETRGEWAMKKLKSIASLLPNEVTTCGESKEPRYLHTFLII